MSRGRAAGQPANCTPAQSRPLPSARGRSRSLPQSSTISAPQTGRASECDRIRLNPTFEFNLSPPPSPQHGKLSFSKRLRNVNVSLSRPLAGAIHSWRESSATNKNDFVAGRTTAW
jgi:hypothetical protein